MAGSNYRGERATYTWSQVGRCVWIWLCVHVAMYLLRIYVEKCGGECVDVEKSGGECGCGEMWGCLWGCGEQWG